MFPRMTVAENLDMGAFSVQAWSDPNDLERVLEMFPRLKERFKQQGGTLSGGEQQMLAIGRALMGKPRLLLLDEPSMGLAPMIVAQIFDIVREINASGVTVLLVEQNAAQALGLADRGYVLETGEIVLQGTGRNCSPTTGSGPPTSARRSRHPSQDGGSGHRLRTASCHPRTPGVGRPAEVLRLRVQPFVAGPDEGKAW